MNSRDAVAAGAVAAGAVAAGASPLEHGGGGGETSAHSKGALSISKGGIWRLYQGREEPWHLWESFSTKSSASESAEFATREALHLHGGMGYTWEVDCHLYLKRSRELALRLGSIRRWKEKLVAATLASTRDSETTPTWLANS